MMIMDQAHESKNRVSHTHTHAHQVQESGASSQIHSIITVPCQLFLLLLLLYDFR